MHERDYQRRRFQVWLLAMLALFPLAIGAGFWHTDAPGSSEATCPICHVAHMPALASPFAALPVGLAGIEKVVRAEARIGHAAPSSLLPPPRAPPA
jgi:hypothetical protein